MSGDSVDLVDGFKKKIDLKRLKERIGDRVIVASVSGGKDSTAMSLYLRELDLEHRRVFMDTGWEHDLTYEYLNDLEKEIGPIERISAAHKMVSLILKRGMFPSRQVRFCTQELKVFPMQRYLNTLVDTGVDVLNTVGIRRAESKARSQMKEWDFSDGFDCEVWRPLIHWSEQDVIDIHTRHDVRPNPLYLKGASRVGCFPCIFARKSEIHLISEIAPERIDLIERLEQRVSQRAETRYAAKGETFESLGYNRPAWFQNPNPAKVVCRTCDGIDPDCPACSGRGTRRYGGPMSIRDVVDWSKTDRKGREVELFEAGESEAGCMRWGLCETSSDEE